MATLVGPGDDLERTYRSLLGQSATDWEWLLVPEAGVDVPADWTEDPRVRLLVPSAFVAAQGDAGRRLFAFEESARDYLLELGADESLHTDAVATLLHAIESTEADVIYPDFAPAVPDEYSAQEGWRTYELRSAKRRDTAVEAFDPEPSALHQAAFAPRFGLTWRRSAFLSLDGPDPNLEGAADFDLTCRAYTAGLVFQRAHRSVVFRQSPRRDPDVDIAVSDRYAHLIVHEWCGRGGLPMLALGDAADLPSGFTTARWNQGLPFEDATVGCISAHDFLNRCSPCSGVGCRHGTDAEPPCIVGAMNELYRVLVPGGWLITETPSSDGPAAFQNPTYRSFWNPNSFRYYSRREDAATVPGLECRFQCVRVRQLYPTERHEADRELWVHGDLVALKGQRQPGACGI